MDTFASERVLGERDMEQNDDAASTLATGFGASSYVPTPPTLCASLLHQPAGAGGAEYHQYSCGP